MNKSQLFKDAWTFLKKGIYKTFSEALKASWQRFKIMYQMFDGQVSFSFRKGNGEIRQATGTLKAQFLPQSSHPGKYNYPDVIKYFDLDKNEWRAFRIERLLKF